jgi:hypothetical protein
MPVERETVVVERDGYRGGRRALAGIVVILVMLVIAFLYFGGYLATR